jgi:deoxycytidylate deaminase
MVHSEINSLANCVVRPDNGTAYVTGQCCNNCIISLWQEGIDTVYMIDDHGTKLFDDEAKKRFDTFVEMSGIKIHYITPNLDWLRQLHGVI